MPLDESPFGVCPEVLRLGFALSLLKQPVGAVRVLSGLLFPSGYWTVESRKRLIEHGDGLEALNGGRDGEGSARSGSGRVGGQRCVAHRSTHLQACLV